MIKVSSFSTVSKNWRFHPLFSDSGIIIPGLLGTGTPDGTAVLHGDGTWSAPTPTPTPSAAPNTVYSGPNSGTASDTPTFRALTSADIPALPQSRITDLLDDLDVKANYQETNQWSAIQEFQYGFQVTGAASITTGEGLEVTYIGPDAIIQAYDHNTSTAKTISLNPLGGPVNVGAGGLAVAGQTANRVFAGPVSGGTASAAFRALVAADLPASVALKDAANTFTSTSGQVFTGPLVVNHTSGITLNGNGVTFVVDGGGGGSYPYFTVKDGNYQIAFTVDSTSTYIQTGGANTQPITIQGSQTRITSTSGLLVSGPATFNSTATHTMAGVFLATSTNTHTFAGPFTFTSATKSTFSAVPNMPATTGNVLYASGTNVISAGTPDTAGLVDKASSQTIAGSKIFTGGLQSRGSGGQYTVRIGDGADVVGSSGVAIGNQSIGSGIVGAVTIGINAVATGNYGEAIGHGASAAAGAIGIGSSVVAVANTVAIGTGSSTAHSGAIVIGINATSFANYDFNVGTTLGIAQQNYIGNSSTTLRRIATVTPSWSVSTDASRLGRVTIGAWDSSALREGLRIESNGTVAQISIGGGTLFKKLLYASATRDFGSIAAGASEDLTIAVTGATTTSTVEMQLPAAPAAGIVFHMFVSAADIVTVRATNVTGSPVDPASATYGATVRNY